ncbi:calcium-binding protein [Streptomyces sp. NPDC050535]|uniref:calcium-binding protein n=1 Tax=Streptomyces sp. NPDC050535 TaxID=3365626 RepID=UPI0037AC53EC
MRIRASVAVVTGALALSALAVPAAQADSSNPVSAFVKSIEPNGAVGATDYVDGDTTISNVVVNGGKAVVVGATARKTVTVSFTAKDDSGIEWGAAVLWHGSTFDSIDGGVEPNEDEAVCTTVNATTSTCKQTFTIDPRTQLLNKLAGGWKVWALAQGKDADLVQKDNVKGFSIQRASQLTVNAAPEPVKKGKTITVTGKLTRADWDTNKNVGLSGQSVVLQFRKASSSTYTNVKGIKSTSGGALKTTVKASVDGYYRYTYAGIASTAAVSATGDYIDVN